MEYIEYLKQNMQIWGLRPTEIQCNQLYTYFNMLVETNQHMNLTAITDFNEVVIKHFVDSVAITQLNLISENTSIIDIGTGAGFPGIPIKIMYPHCRMTLLDSLNKRVGFLNNVISELRLDHIEAVHGRAEEYLKEGQCREQYDICVSRAVANLSVLSEYCIPYVKPGGIFISYKSGSSKDEIDSAINAINLLGGSIENIIDFELPYTDITRKLVVIKKVDKTPEKYPRRSAKIAKNPL